MKYSCKHCNGMNFDFLIGKSIIKVEEENDLNKEEHYFILTCDDGMKIKVTTNNGCYGCDNG
jgi:hypothetical protein